MVSPSVLIPSKVIENAQTTQYTSTNLTTIIDKFTAINYGGSPATISVNLVTVGNSASNDNIVTQTRTLQASEVYIFPEIVGHILGSGDYISTIAGSANSITVRSSGRKVTQ